MFEASIRTITSPVLLVLLSLCAGCTVRVFSPPATALPLESPATLGAGNRAVRGEVAGGTQVFGPGVSAYRAEYIHGVSSKVNLSAAAGAMRLHNVPAGNPRTGMYSARVGMKYAPIREFALHTGLAPGASVGGGFLAYDAGLTAGAENHIFVPFFTVRALLSAPVAARTVRVVSYDDGEPGSVDDDDAPDVLFRKPLLTYGWQVGVGFKIPLRFVHMERVPPALTCAVGTTDLTTRHGSTNIFVTGCGLEVGL